LGRGVRTGLVDEDNNVLGPSMEGGNVKEGVQGDVEGNELDEEEGNDDEEGEDEEGDT
jgi:hypothetical protein